MPVRLSHSASFFRGRELAVLHYRIIQKLTLKEVGEKMGVTAGRVAQIEGLVKEKARLGATEHCAYANTKKKS